MRATIRSLVIISEPRVFFISLSGIFVSNLSFFILNIHNTASFSSWMKNSHIHAVGMGEDTTGLSPWSIIFIKFE